MLIFYALIANVVLEGILLLRNPTHLPTRCVINHATHERYVDILIEKWELFIIRQFTNEKKSVLE